MKSRTRTIQSGDHFEIELFPVTADGRRCDRKHKLSPEQQRAYNQKRAAKKLERLINSNFVEGDIIITLQYRAELRPTLDYAAVLRNTRNYLRRVKECRKREGLPAVKYVYAIERTGKNNWHTHLIMSAIPREVAESLWTFADFVNSRRYQPTMQEGGAAFANYIAGKKGGKDFEKHGRNWNSSQNLMQPTVTTEDGTRTRRELARLARERMNDKEYWEHKFKGYRFVSAKATFNEFNLWWYITVRMYRIESPAAVCNRQSHNFNTAATHTRA